MTNEELIILLKNHKHWVRKDCEGWQNMRARLSGADLRYADLSYADLSGADEVWAQLKVVDRRVNV